jgi:altronate hydrolase
MNAGWIGLSPDVSKWTDKTFMGFHRADGSVGTANYWLVIPLVFCENRNVDVMKQAFVEKLGYKKEKAYEQDVEQLINLYKRRAFYR